MKSSRSWQKKYQFQCCNFSCSPCGDFSSCPGCMGSPPPGVLGIGLHVWAASPMKRLGCFPRKVLSKRCDDWPGHRCLGVCSLCSSEKYPSAVISYFLP
eukprot:jgi/Botrbrau1/17949/Bobra.50_1s0044.1